MQKNLRFFKPLLLAGLTFILLFSSLFMYSPTHAMTFKDLSTEDECQPYVHYLIQKNVIKGFPDGTFQPGGVVTRAQMAQMLVNANTITTKQKTALDFTDVTPDHWAYKAIKSAVQFGFLAGYPDGTFRPEAPATRAEVAAMLLRLTTAPMPQLAPPSGATDLSNHWASLSVAVALDAGIMNLDAKNAFAPEKPANRAEVAQGLAIMLTLSPEQNSVNLTGTLIPVKGKLQIANTNGTIIDVTAASLCGKGDTVITGPNSTAQLEFPDGSGFKINENTRLIIKAALGCATILPNGTEGAVIDTLEVELPEGQIFGALSSTYRHSDDDNNSINKPTAVLDHPILLASLNVPSALAAAARAQQAELPWYEQSAQKKVRVKVDMPWGVAAIRGTFWMNEVRNGREITNAATGDVEVTAGGQTVAVGAGQTTAITGSNTPPAPPTPMPPQQQQLWNMERQWVQQTAGNMEAGMPLIPAPPSNPQAGANEVEQQIMNNIREAVPGFGTTPPSDQSGHSSGGQPSVPTVAAPTVSPSAGTYGAAQ